MSTLLVDDGANVFSILNTEANICKYCNFRRILTDTIHTIDDLFTR